MNNEIVKPVTVIRAELIDTLTNAINNSGLPAFVIEPILKDMYNEVRVAAQRQLDTDRQQYQEKVNQHVHMQECSSIVERADDIKGAD